MHKDVGIGAGLRLAEHHFETAVQPDAAFNHLDRSNRNQLIGERIESASFHIRDHETQRVQWRRSSDLRVRAVSGQRQRLFKAQYGISPE